MKVAIVCPYAWDLFGGVQSHVRALARALRARGHEVLVIAPSLRRSEVVAGEEGVVLAGRSVRIPANGSVASLAFGPGAARSLRRAIDRFQPQVLHLHEPLIPSLSLLALRAATVPAVGTFHAAAPSSAGYGLGRPVLGRLWRRLALTTAVSEDARSLVARYFPGDYALTPNGVETARFAEAQPRPVTAGRTVLFLGRIERRKGLEVLIRATARLTTDRVTLVVGGTGPQERDCRKLAARLGVDPIFRGRVLEAELPGLYRGATVYCAPGVGGESFGIVLVEAMAAGTPVVCSDLPGYRSVAEPAALLVPPGDASALAAALDKVLEDERLRADMAEAGRERARDFDWGPLAADVERLYERALA